MFRVLLLTIVLLAYLPVLAQAGTRLRPAATVDGDVITVGDLFEGAGAAAGQEVAPAPAPGRTATYRAKHLAAIARAYGLDWRPVHVDDAIVVSRSALFLSEDELMAAITRHLGSHTADGLRIELTQRSSRIPAPADPAQSVDVLHLDLDRDSGRFSAELAVPGAGASQTVYGRAISVLELPVPVRTIPRGALVSAADIEWREVRAAGLPADLLESEDGLVGMAARRSLRAGKPIREVDVTPPIIVSKGSLVTMSLQSPGLTLSGTGRALEDGAKGDVIRIMNTRSKRTIEGTVVGPDLVRITPRRQIAATTDR